MDRFYAGVRARGFEYGQAGNLFDLTGVPDDRIAVRVDTRAVAGRKWRAILRHQSQLDEHQRIPEPLRWIVLDAECFVQAYPHRAPGEPVAGRPAGRAGRCLAVRIGTVADTVLRVRYAPGSEVRDGADGLLVDAAPTPAASPSATRSAPA